MLQWIYCTCMKHGNGPINLLMDLHMYGFTYVGISFCPVPTVTDSSVPFGIWASISDVSPLSSEDIYIGLIGGELPLLISACVVALSVSL